MAEKKTKEELIQEEITARLEEIEARKEAELKAGFLTGLELHIRNSKQP